MKTKTRIQFSKKWNILDKYLPSDIAGALKNLINPTLKFPSVTLNSQDELAISLRKINIIVDGRSILRLIREIVRIEETDIKEDGAYDFMPGSSQDEEVKLEGDPADYYELHVECEHCGRYKWIQKSDLQLKMSMNLDIDESESGEILISDRLKKVFDNEKLNGFTYRKVIAEKSIWQLMPHGQAVVKKPNEYLKGKNNCTFCGKPRILVYEDTNGIELFKPPYDIPRIERTPVLLLQNMPGDFSVTDLEFGTLGRLPEGSSQVQAKEFTHKTSNAKWVVSGKLCKILYEKKVKGFELSPAQIC